MVVYKVFHEADYPESLQRNYISVKLYADDVEIGRLKLEVAADDTGVAPAVKGIVSGNFPVFPISLDLAK